MMLSKRLLAGLILLFSATSSMAQQLHTHNWYFGDSELVMRFDFGNNDPYLDSIPNTLSTGGSMVATNPVNGSVLFYADGEFVYDASNQLMSPVVLGGAVDENQPVTAFPLPNLNNRYIVIAKTQTNTVLYYEVDLTAPGNANGGAPLGEIAAIAGPAIPSPSEGMLAIRGNNAVHLILQNSNATDQLEILEFDGFGFSNQITIDLPYNLELAHVAYSEASNRVALAPKNPTANIAIFDFDPAADTVLQFNSAIFNSGYTDISSENIYDVEWSNDGSKLYFSRFGSNGLVGNVYQFDFSVDNFLPQSILSGPVFESFGLQRGPDGNIYHLYRQNSTDPIAIGQISNIDSAVNEVTYTRNFFGTGIQFEGQQFPSLAPPFDITPVIDYTYLDSCQRSTTKFFPDISPEASAILWDFGDGSTSNAHSPIHQFQNPGSYDVSLSAIINGGIETFTQTIEIIANNDSVSLGMDTVICPGEVLTLDATENLTSSPANYTYIWSDGSTGSQLDVDTAGTFWVAVTNATGCTVYDAIEVTLYGNQDQTSNQWYFGQNAGIDFNGGPSPLDDGAMVTPEGAATVSDQNGDLLFYTDGQTVYNRIHQVMANDLMGTPDASQSAIIVPFPDDETMYYIFTTRATYGDNNYTLYYSVVDMKTSEHGDVVIRNVPLYENNTERITAVEAGNLTWLVTHEYGTNAFRTYPITADGIITPIISNAGSIHSIADELNGRGYMKLSANAERLAVVLPGSGAGDDVIELFDFVDTLGRVENVVRIPLNEAGGQQAYGLEFSQNASKLFVSLTGSPSTIFEYYLDTTATEIVNSGVPLNGTVSGELGAIQTGPDGQIYVAINNNSSLGLITPAEAFDEVSTYVDGGFTLAGGTQSKLGLPNFIQNVVPPSQSPSITVSDNCLGQTTTFVGTGTSIIDEFSWTFGDGNSATGDSTSHTYAVDSVYLVSLNITNRCGLDSTLTQTITIFQEAPTPTISDTTFCRDSNLFLNANINNIPDLTYSWNTGDSTSAIIVTDQGNYSVTIQDENGCTASASAFVSAGGPDLNLGPDLVFCEGDPVTQLNTQDAIPTYEWFVNGTANGNTSQIQNIDTSVPGLFTYVVVGTDPPALGGCSNADTVNITISAAPSIGVTSIVADSCGIGNGILDIEVTATTTSIQYSWTGPGFSANTEDIAGLAAGAYSLTAIDNNNGCAADTTLSVPDIGSNFNITNVLATPACEDAGSIDVNLDVPQDYDYTLTNLTTNTTQNGSIAGSDVLNLINLSPSDYLIVFTDAGNCTEDTIVNLTEAPQLVVDIAEDIITACGVNVSVTATSSTNPADFLWTGPAANPATSATTTVSQSGLYVVEASDPTNTLCPARDSVQVVLSEPQTIVIDESGDPCEGQVDLITSISGGTGPFRTVWNTGATTPSLTVTRSGNYTLTVIDQSTGCEVVEGPIPLTISPAFTVSLLSPSFCDQDTILLRSVTTAQNPSYTWTFNGESTGFSGPNVVVFGENFIRLDVEDVNGCVRSDSIDVVRYETTPSELVAVAYICPADPDNSEALLDPGGDFSLYEWTLPNNAISNSPSLTVNSGGRYSVRLTNAFGCISEDEVNVIEQCIPQIFAPTAFKPISNIPENRAFSIESIFVNEFEIIIYNRWGEPVYSSSDKEFEWFGNRSRGDAAPSGTYAYVIRYTGLTDDTRRELRGVVTLIR